MINGFCARIGDKSGHHPWISRDYMDFDCRATGCMFNKNNKCGVPSICKMDETGKCKGFHAKQAPAKVDGD